MGPEGTPLDRAGGLSAAGAKCDNIDSNSLKTLKVIQVNLNKSNSAMQELTINLRKEKDFICLVTEPSVIRHRLSGIPKHYSTVPTLRENSPRAAIFASHSLEIQEIGNLNHRDLAVGLIKCGNKRTAIISAYMDIKNSPVTELLTNAIHYCKEKGYSILLAVDTNSHSKLWGNETNTRGKNGRNMWNRNSCWCIIKVEFRHSKVKMENQL